MFPWAGGVVGPRHYCSKKIAAGSLFSFPNINTNINIYNQQRYAAVCCRNYLSSSLQEHIVPLGPALSSSYTSPSSRHKSRGHLSIFWSNPTFKNYTVLNYNTAKDIEKRNFSCTPLAMTATKIDGTAIAKKIRDKLREEIEETQKSNPRYKPSLKIIQGTFGEQ